MKNFFSKILISIVLGAMFFAPVLIGIKTSKKTDNLQIEIALNSASAQEIDTNWSVVGVVTDLSLGIFKVSSEIAHLGGSFLDFFVFYSTNSTSYNSDFVKKAWGIVRDIMNIAFIIGLFYLAAGVILDLHSANVKKTITSVIVVGLLINFSLFATKVVIDASNLLTKVFYNNITSYGPNGEILPAGLGGQKSVSVGIVDKFNPQKLVSQEAYNKEKWTFIFMTLLLSAVTIYTAYIFFSVALLFVARVASLWLSMIFAPLAFASFVLPFNIPGFAFSKWIDNLTKNAFLAPLFVFMLYIIILFTESLKEIISYGVTEDAELMQRIMGVVVPFTIIVVLLMKSKELAVEYSGQIGQLVNTAGKAIAGLTIGGAAGITALVGRQVLGRSAASLTRGKEAVKYAETRKDYRKDLLHWKAKVADVKANTTGSQRSQLVRTLKQSKPQWGSYKSANNLSKNLFDILGGRISASQEKVNEVEHARHSLESIKEKAGLKGVEEYQMSGVQIARFKKEFIKANKSDFISDLRDGEKGADIWEKNALGVETNLGNIGENKYKASKRDEIIRQVIATPNAGDLDSNNELTDKGRKRVENLLNDAFNEALKISIGKLADHEFEHERTHARESVSTTERVLARSTSGSYDVRNINTKPADRREGLSTKATMMLVAAVALGIRSGLKSIKSGDVKGDFFTDLGSTISTALKTTNVKIDIGGGDSGGGHGADHGGGDHGGGHH